MNAPDALRALASYCGIADDYLDVWGKRHATTDETRHALLAAMHLPVHDTEPAIILRALQQAAWRRTLPPVQVVRSGESIRIELGVPARAAKHPWRWTLRFESGEVRSDEFIPAGLPKLGKRRLASADFSPHAKAAEVLRCVLELPGIAVLGYHHFEIEMPGSDLRPGMTLIVAPPTCYQPAAIRGDSRVWGPTVQLYGLRSRRNWGIGDFTDLRNLVDITADAGGGIVGVNPLHALFPDNPAHVSPYSPSSRSALNVLYIDVEALPEFRECPAAQALVAEPAFQARLRSLRAEDRRAVAEAAAASGLELKVQSAFALDEGRRAELARVLAEVTGKTLPVEYRENPELLAGFHVSIGPWILHANLRDELKFFSGALRHAG